MSTTSLRISISFMVAYAVLQSLVWASVRVLSLDLSTETLFFFRNLIGAVTLVPLLFRQGFGLFKTERFSVHFWRAFAAGVGGLTLYYAVAHAPLGTVVAITFLAPIIASFVSMVFYKERATATKLFALGMGFAGVLVVARPSLDGAWDGIVAAFIGAIATAAAYLLVKNLSATEKASTIVVLPFLLLLPLSALVAAFNWTPPQLADVPLLLAMGFGFSIAQYALTKAFHYGEASTVLPIDYLRLIAASAIGTVFFGDAVNVWVFAGALMILIASVMTARQKQPEH